VEAGVIAYKFLGEGRVGPFTGFQWPVGEWVDAERVETCRTGIHACRVFHLPFWLDDELWEIELEGELTEHERKVVARRGRLVRRQDEWNADLRAEFVDDVLRRTRLRFGAVAHVGGYVTDIQRFRAERRTGLAAFAAARAAEVAGGPGAYERERLRQAEWLARRLDLNG
jgi:hypothetical protein